LVGKTTTMTTADAIVTDAAPSAAATSPAPLPCANECTSTDASTPDHVPHAAAADAPPAFKAGWFVRAVSGLKDKWRAVTVAAAIKAPATPKKHAPSPRAASATSTSSQSTTTAQVTAAAPAGATASAPEAPKKASWLARTLAAANAKCDAASDSAAASWRATAAKASAALTPKRNASLKKCRSVKADTANSCLLSSPAVDAPAAGPMNNSGHTPAAADDAAVLVTIAASTASELAATALKPGPKASAKGAPGWGKSFGDRLRAALPRARSSRRLTVPSLTAPAEARSGLSAKACDAEPVNATAAHKGRIGAALTAKLARLSSRRSRSRPDQAAAAAEAIGGEAAVAC
jgi:hypothetical protein